MPLNDSRKNGLVNYLLSGSPVQLQVLRDRYMGTASASVGDVQDAITVISGLADAAEVYGRANSIATFEEAVEQLLDDAELERTREAQDLVRDAITKRAIVLPVSRYPNPDMNDLVQRRGQLPRARVLRPPMKGGR